MRKIIKELGVIMITATLCMSTVGCGNDKDKKSETAASTETTVVDVVTTDTEKITSTETTSVETTIIDETTSKKEEETTTKVVEETTTKKQEITKKQETTTKKQETTTKKQETTTKKQETTTKQPETTTKQPETTTKAPEVPKTWFEKMGYKITAKSTVLKAINGNETREEYKCNVVIEESIWEENPEYKWITCWITDGEENWISLCAFDRYTGIEYVTGFEYVDGYLSSKRMINGKEVTIYFDGAMSANTYVRSIAVPKDYDGVVFVCGGSSIGRISYNQELDENEGPFMLDEYCSFDKNDVYFISVDDK